MPKFSIARANLLGVEIVLADAGIVRAAVDENPDLLWLCAAGAATSAWCRRLSSSARSGAAGYRRNRRVAAERARNAPALSRPR